MTSTTEVQCENCKAVFDLADSLMGYRAPSGRPMVLCINCGRYTPAPTETGTEPDTDTDTNTGTASAESGATTNTESRRLVLTEESDGWIACAEACGVASKGTTRADAIRNLDEALTPL